MQISVSVCDIDPQPGVPAEGYTITKGEQQVTVDLCEEHAAFLEQLLSTAVSNRAQVVPVATFSAPDLKVANTVTRKHAARPTKKTAPAAPKRRTGIQVKTLAQIEAEKAQN